MNGLTITELKVLWVVGATERLATLGMLNSDVPLKISSDAIDTFIEVDNHRNILFNSDFEIAQIFKTIARSEFSEQVDDEELDEIVDLILQYKNHREDVVRYALSHMKM